MNIVPIICVKILQLKVITESFACLLLLDEDGEGNAPTPGTSSRIRTISFTGHFEALEMPSIHLYDFNLLACCS